MPDKVTIEVLAGVGKKMRSGFNAGNVAAEKVLQCYHKNLKEASEFSGFGMTVFDLIELERKCHNPLLRKKLQDCIQQHKEKSRASNEQNKLSLKKLEYFRRNALGMGLHAVIASMKHIVKSTNDDEARIILTLLEIEFANLSAKKLHKYKEAIYERKSILLEQASDLLHDHKWRYGIAYNTGKNASYIIYVYLPDGTQLSWHCNEYTMVYCFPEINCEWDGQVCMTMEKILRYICLHYRIGTITEYIDTMDSAA